MKRIPIFLILAFALAGVAFAQGAVSDASTTVTFDCPDDECHVLPYFKGEGGFIGRILPGLEEVTYHIICGDGSVTRSSTPDGGGIVSALFNPNNGLACDRDDGEFQIHGVMDGGWYWITDEENTAVSFLIPSGVLANRKIAPANPGWPGLTFSASRDGSVSFVKEVGSGRVGILPHILPLPGEPEPLRCGQYKECEGSGECEAEARVTKQRTDDCLLDAVYSVRVTTGLGTGAENAITSGQIFRPGSGTTTLTLGLYGTGHLDITEPLGAGFDQTLTATWTATARVESAAGLPAAIGTERAWGISGDLDNGTLTVHNPTDSDETCTEPIGYTVVVEIKATAGANDIVPAVPGETLAGDFRPSTMLRIRCPGAAAAAAGRELVPDDLFSN